MSLPLKVTNVYQRHIHHYQRLKNSGIHIPIIAHRGGSRSSKTISIMQKFANDSYYAEKPEAITISRAKLTWLKATVLRDFEWMVAEYGIPIQPYFNPRRAEQEYDVFGSQWAFIGLDEKMKLHGRKQKRAWVNEVMECREEDFLQLEMRTEGELVVDYNPMALDHWVYKLDLRPECAVINSTQLDNPFLPEGIRKRILGFEPTRRNIERGTADKYYWEVYGLGKKAVQKGRIYKKVRYVDRWPMDEDGNDLCKWTIYGLDFGYSNDPTVVVKVGLYAGELYVKQLLWREGLTNVGQDGDKDTIDYQLRVLGLTKSDTIIADSAEPKSIKELRKAGWSVQGAEKGPDSIKNGIDAVKRYEIVCVDSMDMKKEFENYKWSEDASGKLTNKPVDAFNHGMDAMRYAATKRIKKSTKTMHATN